MKELTADMAIELKYSPRDCVRYYKPDVSDEEADYILWEETCFPMSTDTFLKQLYHMFNKEVIAQ